MARLRNPASEGICEINQQVEIMNIPRTFVLTVKRTMDTYEKERQHLAERGIACEPFIGLDNLVFRLNPIDTFDIDRAGDHIGQKQVCAHMSHYLIWKVMSYLPDDAFWVLEYDAEFVPQWRFLFNQAMNHAPDDWDMIYMGSCCCGVDPAKWPHLGGGLFEVKWPLCGHAIMYRKKALPVLLEAHQKVWAPLDIAMKHDSLPKLKVYTILPRIVSQRNTFIPP